MCQRSIKKGETILSKVGSTFPYSMTYLFIAAKEIIANGSLFENSCVSRCWMNSDHICDPLLVPVPVVDVDGGRQNKYGLHERNVPRCNKQKKTSKEKRLYRARILVLLFLSMACSLFLTPSLHLLDTFCTLLPLLPRPTAEVTVVLCIGHEKRDVLCWRWQRGYTIALVSVGVAKEERRVVAVVVAICCVCLRFVYWRLAN